MPPYRSHWKLLLFFGVACWGLSTYAERHSQERPGRGRRHTGRGIDEPSGDAPAPRPTAEAGETAAKPNLFSAERSKALTAFSLQKAWNDPDDISKSAKPSESDKFVEEVTEEGQKRFKEFAGLTEAAAIAAARDKLMTDMGLNPSLDEDKSKFEAISEALRAKAEFPDDAKGIRALIDATAKKPSPFRNDTHKKAAESRLTALMRKNAPAIAALGKSGLTPYESLYQARQMQELQSQLAAARDPEAKKNIAAQLAKKATNFLGATDQAYRKELQQYLHDRGVYGDSQAQTLHLQRMGRGAASLGVIAEPGKDLKGLKDVYTRVLMPDLDWSKAQETVSREQAAGFGALQAASKKAWEANAELGNKYASLVTAATEGKTPEERQQARTDLDKTWGTDALRHWGLKMEREGEQRNDPETRARGLKAVEATLGERDQQTNMYSVDFELNNRFGQTGAPLKVAGAKLPENGKLVVPSAEAFSQYVRGTQTTGAVARSNGQVELDMTFKPTPSSTPGKTSSGASTRELQSLVIDAEGGSSLLDPRIEIAKKQFAEQIERRNAPPITDHSKLTGTAALARASSALKRADPSAMAALTSLLANPQSAPLVEQSISKVVEQVRGEPALGISGPKAAVRATEYLENMRTLDEVSKFIQTTPIAAANDAARESLDQVMQTQDKAAAMEYLSARALYMRSVGYPEQAKYLEDYLNSVQKRR